VDSSSLISPLAQVPTDLLSLKSSRLENEVRAAQGAAGKDQKSELKKVSQQFEAIFIAQLLKVMRETIEESGLMEGGFGKSIYTDLFDQEVSISMAKRNSLGISDLLYRNLLHRVSESDQPESKAPAPVNAAPSTTGSSVESEPEISDLQLPVQAPVSSGFGMRTDPISGRLGFHKGVDLAAPEGVKVVAALPGKVISAGYENGYGNTVLIQHSGGFQTRYGHLGSVSVKTGDLIDSDQLLGTVGTTGHSTGPHLHFEVIRDGKPVNPTAGIVSKVASSQQHSSVYPKMGS
jgi:murein DD-endopeptidase MepM/ murein hydrolase activator NlpD